MKCSQCGTTKADATRLPKGWRRIGDDVWCDKCKKAAYRTVAITVPIAGPCGEMTWAELRKMLADSFAESTRCANWIMRELYVRDVRRTPELAKLPKWEAPYLYPETAQFALPSQSRAAMEQAVKGKYRAVRYPLLWTGEQNLASFRFPYPYAVPNQSWSVRVEYGSDGKSPTYIVSLPLVGSGGRVDVRLSGARDFARQLAMVRQIVIGEAIKGECAIYRRRAKESDGRNGEKQSNGAASHRYMLKMVATVPIAARATGTKVFRVATANESFLRGEIEGRTEPWLLHNDQFRDQCYQYCRWLHRMADDSKWERRKPKRRRKAALTDYATRAAKFRDRQKSFMQETAAKVVGFAKRNGAGVVAYDDTLGGYFPSFSYFEFGVMLGNKCHAEGLFFDRVGASGGVSDKAPVTARDDVDETEGE